jgi:hypothetical protein
MEMETYFLGMHGLTGAHLWLRELQKSVLLMKIRIILPSSPTRHVTGSLETRVSFLSILFFSKGLQYGLAGVEVPLWE